MRRYFMTVLVLAAACSEGPAPFQLDNDFPPGGPDGVRLTYNPNDDRAPTWSADSDTVYYMAESYPPFPVTNGLLLAAPRTGGVVEQVFAPAPLLQPAYTAPSAARDGARMAFFEIDVQWRYFCSLVINPDFPESMPDTAGMLPLLQQAVLRVRPMDRTATDEATLRVQFGGRHVDESGVVVIEGALFQRLYSRYRSATFRASWSPDGQRVVFSDGVQLLLWTVGAAAATPIANTSDGVWPAWSPDGQWIAFSQLTRGREERYRFNCLDSRGNLLEMYDVTLYNPSPAEPGESRLLLIRPDGTGLRDLGPGEAPSWLPNSTEVVFAQNGQLWRAPVDGGAAEPIPNTGGGHEPAVAPNGEWLAFSRVSVFINKRDLWVVPL